MPTTSSPLASDVLVNSLIKMEQQSSIAGAGDPILHFPPALQISPAGSSSSFFQKDKKVEDLQENFINGLIFPTTAHFSSFISNRCRPKDSSKVSVKAKLFMFDVS